MGRRIVAMGADGKPIRHVSTVGAIAMTVGAFAVMMGAGIASFVTSTPCPTEDSTWCTWNGGAHGNGTGRSFVTLWDGFTIYTS